VSLQILRPVTIKAKVTEGLKVNLAREIGAAIQMLDEEVQQLETQVKRPADRHHFAAAADAAAPAGGVREGEAG
jgi:hypothetical protein